MDANEPEVSGLAVTRGKEMCVHKRIFFGLTVFL